MDTNNSDNEWALLYLLNDIPQSATVSDTTNNQLVAAPHSDHNYARATASKRTQKKRNNHPDYLTKFGIPTSPLDKLEPRHPDTLGQIIHECKCFLQNTEKPKCTCFLVFSENTSGVIQTPCLDCFVSYFTHIGQYEYNAPPDIEAAIAKAKQFTH